MMPAGAELDIAAARAMGWTKPSERGRCDVCGWPVVPEDEPGCWVSNCSMRPPPEHRGDVPARVSQEAGYIPRLLAWLNERGAHVELEQDPDVYLWDCEAYLDGTCYRDLQVSACATIQHALANLVVAVAARKEPTP